MAQSLALVWKACSRPGLAVAVAAAFGLAGCEERPPAPQFTYTDMNGAPVSLQDLDGKAAVLMFWRTDCAPCLIEFQWLEQLQEEAEPAEFITVALQDRESAAAYLTKTRNPSRRAWVAVNAPEEVLTGFNGPPPRLPLSVAIDRKGRICAVRAGLLGTDRAKEWGRKCS